MNVVRSIVFAILAVATVTSAPAFADVPSCCVGGNCCAHGKCCPMPGCCKTDKSCCDPAKGVCTSACGCLTMSCCGTGNADKKAASAKSPTHLALSGKATFATVKNAK